MRRHFGYRTKDGSHLSGFRSSSIMFARAGVNGEPVLLEDVDEPANKIPEAANGALVRLSQHGIASCVRFLVSVEVRTVDVKACRVAPKALDPLLHLGPFEARQIVHGHDIALCDVRAP